MPITITSIDVNRKGVSEGGAVYIPAGSKDVWVNVHFTADTINKPCAYIKVYYDDELLGIYTGDGYVEKLTICNAKYSGVAPAKITTVTEGTHSVVVETGEIIEGEDVTTDTFEFTIMTEKGILRITDIQAPETVAMGEYYDLRAKVKNVSGAEADFQIAVYWTYPYLETMYLLGTQYFEDRQNIKTVHLKVGEETEVTFRPVGFGEAGEYRMAIAPYNGDRVSVDYACSTEFEYG
jgi:hypothetical protein